MRPYDRQQLQPESALVTYDSSIERDFGSHGVWQRSKCGGGLEYNVGRRDQLPIRSCTDSIFRHDSHNLWRH